MDQPSRAEKHEVEAVLSTLAKEFGIPASRLEALVQENTEIGKPSRALMTAELKKWEGE